MKGWAIERDGTLVAGTLASTRDNAWCSHALEDGFKPYIGHPPWCRCPKCLRLLREAGYRAVRVVAAQLGGKRP